MRDFLLLQMVSNLRIFRSFISQWLITPSHQNYQQLFNYFDTRALDVLLPSVLRIVYLSASAKPCLDLTGANEKDSFLVAIEPLLISQFHNHRQNHL